MEHADLGGQYGLSRLGCMSDPPRQGVREAIEKCHRASIRIIMVTGDYGLTALSIAKKSELYKGTMHVLFQALNWQTWMTISLKKLLKAKSFLLV